TDDGVTFTARTPPSGGSFLDFAVDPANSNVCYTTSASFSGTTRFWRTADAGVTWTALTGSGAPALPNLPAYSIAEDPGPTTATPDDVLYAGRDTGVWRSTDGGATWSKLGTGLPNAQVRDLEYNPTLQILAAGTYGRGIWEISTAPVAPQSLNGVQYND